MGSLWALERGTLWVLDLERATVLLREPAVAVRWVEAGPESAAAVASAIGLAEPGSLLARMGRGARLFAGSVEGRIACLGWVSPGGEDIGELERRIKLPQDEAYAWDCLTLPGFRRLGLYTALLGSMAVQLQAEGTRRLWIGASVTNRPSVRGFASAGFRPVLEVLFVRAGMIRFFAAHGRRSASKALVDEAREALRKGAG